MAPRRGVRRSAELPRRRHRRGSVQQSGADLTASVARIGRERVVVWQRCGHPRRRASEHRRRVRHRLRLAGRLLARRRSCVAVGLLRGEPPGRRRDRRARARGGLLRGAPGRSSSAEPAILVLATNTYNAYNQWGGRCLYSDAVKVSFDRPFERGYVRRPAAPVATAYDGRVASISPTADDEHVQLPAVPCRLRLPAVVRVGGLALVGTALRPVGGGRGHRARLRDQLRSRVPPRGARRPEVHAEHRPRRVLVVGDARPGRCVRRRRGVVGDLLGRHLLLAGALRGRRPHDGRLQGPVPRRGPGPRHRPTAASCRRSGPCRPSAGPSARRWGSASPAAATRGSARRRRGRSGGYNVHRPEHPIFAGTDLRYGDVLGGPRGSSATRSTAAS